MQRRGFYNPFVWCRSVFVLALKRLPIKAMVVIAIVGLLISGNLFSNSNRPEQAVASTSQSTWWNNNYLYRQQITITAGTDALSSGYIVKTSIDTSALQTASKVRSDRKDWRILYYNTGASSWNEIARDATLTSASYFALQAGISAGASDSNYYAYYGYASESSSPSSTTQNLGVKLNGNPFNTTDAVSTDYVSVADNASLRLTTGMTIEAWINISANDSEVIACKGSGAGDPDYLFSTYTDNSLGLYDGTAWRQSNTGLITNNTWTHVAVTYDGSIYRFFRNGVAVGTSSYTGSIQTSTSDLNIGRQCAATNPYHGLIDDVRIWNTARAEADILANYTSELVGNETGLVAEWKFNNGTGTSATDATSNGFTGTLQNSASWLPARQAVAVAPTVADGSRQEVSTYSLYFNGRSILTNYKIGQASSADGGITYTKSGSNPVLSAVASTWESTWVKDPWAIRVGDAIYLYYAGYDGTTHQIGVARSTDGVNFVKNTNNPIVAVGAGGTWDSNGTLFPTVFFDKDETDPTKIYKMFYTGMNATSHYQIGLAFSGDGINWTKYASNPVVSLGADTTWDDYHVAISSNPIKVGDTYYMLYDGVADTDGAAAYAKWNIGSVSFTSFTGTYTKNAGNPIMQGKPTGVQTLTAQTNSGTTTVTVADTSAFVANEPVLVRDGSSNDEFNRIASVDSATQLTLSTATSRVYAIGSTIQSWMVGSIAPRTLEYINSAWKMWWTAFQPYSNNDLLREMSAYATSANGTSWTIDYANSPTIPFSDNQNDWDGHSSENTAVIVPTQQLGTSPMSSPSALSGSPSTTSINWSWTDNSALESGYKVYDEAANLKNTAAANATSWNETSLSVNTQYIRHVHGYSDYGNSDPSNEYRVYTLANAPGTPTVDTATATTMDVTPNVNSNPASTEFAINETSTGNFVQADGTLGASAVWQTYTNWGGASGKTVTGLSNNTIYTFKVKARNGDNTETAYSSTASGSTDTTSPTTPGTPSATSPTSDTTPTWSWTASTDAGGLATPAYTVQWSTDSSFVSGVNSSTATTNSFTHSSALAENTWYFRVLATDLSSNASSYSSNGTVVVDATAPSATGTPSPATTPTNSTSVSWSWTAATDALSGVANYIWRVTDSLDGAYSNSTTALTNVTTTLIEGIFNFYVKAIDLAGNIGSELSALVTVDLTLPSAPVVSTPAASTTLNASTYAVTGTAEANALVTVYTDVDNDGTVDGGTDTSAGTQQLSGGATSYSISVTLTQDSTNNFTVTATDSATNASTPANVPTLTEDSTGPTTPSISSPTTDTRTNDTTPAFASSAFSDTFSSHSASQWLIDDTSNLFPSPEVDTGDDSTNKVSYTPSALSQGTYYAKVRYKDSTGNYSSFSSVITFIVDTTAPSAPTSVSVAKANSLGGLTVTWTDPVAADLSTIDIYRSTALGTEGSLIANVAGGTGTYSDSSLSNNTTYYYTLKATDTASNTSSATTQANQTTHTSPTKLVISDVSAQTAGTAFSITVTAKDASDNQALLATNSVAITASDSQATLPADSSLVAGTKEFSVNLKTAGSITVTATASGLTVGTATVTVSAGSVSANTSSLVGASATGTVGTAVTLTGTVKDAYSNALSGQTVVLSSSRSADTITQPTATTTSAGVATGSVNATTAGVSTITATVGSTTIGTYEITFSAVASDDSDEDAGSSNSSDSSSGSSSSSSSSSSTSSSSSSSSSTDSATTTSSASTTDSASSSSATPSTTLGAGESTATSATVATQSTADTTTPVAKIAVQKYAVVNEAVAFDGSGSTDDISITSYTWSFPDGSFSTQKSPTYIFKEAGSHTITLSVKDNAGNQDGITTTVYVLYPKPTIVSATQTGGQIVVSGQAEPFATVIIYAFSDPKQFTTTADKTGYYQLKINSSELGAGEHHFTAVALKTSDQTDSAIRNGITNDLVLANIDQTANEVTLTDDSKVMSDITPVQVVVTNPLSQIDKRLLPGIGLIILALALLRAKNKIMRTKKEGENYGTK